MIGVLVTGARGRMGRETVTAVMGDPQLRLVGAVDSDSCGGETAAADITIESDLEEALDRVRPEVLIDFTQPGIAGRNALAAARRGVRPVIGTTGVPTAELEAVMSECARRRIGGAAIANFSLGAMLLDRLAVEAARYLGACEVVELHHDQKIDAPSGTARALVARLQERTGREVPVHSVRLPGLLAHHRVLFGAEGELLTIAHDSTSRRSFMPGLLLTVHRVTAGPRFFTSLAELLD